MFWQSANLYFFFLTAAVLLVVGSASTIQKQKQSEAIEQPTNPNVTQCKTNFDCELLYVNANCIKQAATTNGKSTGKLSSTCQCKKDYIYNAESNRCVYDYCLQSTEEYCRVIYAPSITTICRWSSSLSNFQFADPDITGVYYQCAKGAVAGTHYCLPGLQFDNVQLICDTAENVEKSPDLIKNLCKHQPDGAHMANPLHPELYFDCQNSFRNVLHRCPIAGTHFDNHLQICH